MIFHKNIGKVEEYNAAHKKKEALGIAIPETIKEYESFKGRMNFSDFIELFNFENNIYQDKQFKYSLISNNNKRLIPEFISAACAKLIYDGLIDIEIRPKLEQYLIAILSNLDYHNYATIEQLKDEFKKIQDKHFYFVLGSCPLSFGNHRVEILKERITATDKFFNDLNISSDKAKLYLHNSVADEIKTHKGKNIEIIQPEKNDVKSKLTKEEIKEIFKHLNSNLNTGESYNLVLFASTYHISKIAHEIEKYFYDNTSINYPKNIIIIGTEKFFDLITSNRVLNPKDEKEIQDGIDELFILKKMQSFLFEIFMHSLDKNKQK